MKVLHLISGGDTGGAKTHVFSLIEKLKEMADVKVVCFMNGVFWQELQHIDVPSELLEQKSRLDMSVVNRLVELCHDGVDIVHCHGARANFIATALKKRVHIPMITTVHSDYLLDFDGFYRKLVFTSLNIYALKHFRYFIGVSSNFRNMLISRGFRPNSVYTVYNGMDYSGTPSFVSKEEFAKRIGIPYDENTTYVGLIGRHDYVKGHDVFIKAIKTVLKTYPQTMFVIAGDGDNRQTLVELAQKEGVSDHLVFAGFVKDIYSFINFIDINTLTSRSESFPYVLMEGARMAKPTVCSRVGGIPDFVMDGKTGFLFESENSKELAEKIIRLIADKAMANRFGQALKTLAETNFSSTALAKKHMEIYQAVLRDFYDKKRYDVVMSGYYGFDNSGDDALFEAIKASLETYLPDVRILVLSAKAKQMKSEYGVDCTPRFNPFAVHKAMKQSKMLLFGGGSLLQDVTSSKSLLYYLSVLKMAHRNGIKIFVYANGIGPISDKNLKRTAQVLQKADCITLRDKESLHEWKRMNLAHPPVSVTADPALVLTGTPQEALSHVYDSVGLDAKTPYFGISVRNWGMSDPDFAQKTASIADYVYQTYGLVPFFIPMRFPKDVKISEDIAALTTCKSYVLNQKCSVADTIGLVAGCRFVIGMRLHTLIYAAGNAVPVIGYIYDKKVSGFLDDIGQHRYTDVTHIDVDAVKAYVDDLVHHNKEVVGELSQKRDELYEKALSNARMAVALLQKEEDA